MNNETLIKVEGSHPVIEESIINMVLQKPTTFYGEFTFFLTFISMNYKTCGVNVDKRGNFVFYFNPEFVKNLTKPEMNFVIIHEDFHLLWDHPIRSVGMDKRIANMAMDMIINQIIFEDLILFEGLDYFIQSPKDEDGNNTCLFIPKKYNGEMIFEELYDWLKDDYDKWIKKGIKYVDPDYGTHHTRPSSKKYNNISPGMYSLELFYQNLEKNNGLTLDEHLLDELPPEVKKQLVDKILQNCKNRGLIGDKIEKILNKIRKSKKDYLKDIKRTLSKDIIGTSKEKSIIRPNRRNIEGLKGKIKYKNKINVILDTSGSMTGEFEKVLSYIFRHDIELNLVMGDTEVKDFIVIKKENQLQKMTIKGLGGTELNPLIKFISKNDKLNCYNNVILTDGYTDKLDFTEIKGKTLILSTAKWCPVINNDRVKQIIIDKDE